MTFSTFPAALTSYLTTAGSSVTPVPVIRSGEPDNVNVPTVAYWYLGVRTWEANTFTYTQELIGWMIRTYVPIGPRFVPGDGYIEAYLADLTDEIREELYGNLGAGGVATGEGAEISDAKPGYATVGGQYCRIADMEVWYMVSNAHAIAV